MQLPANLCNFLRTLTTSCELLIKVESSAKVSWTAGDLTPNHLWWGGGSQNPMQPRWVRINTTYRRLSTNNEEDRHLRTPATGTPGPLVCTENACNRYVRIIGVLHSRRHPIYVSTTCVWWPQLVQNNCQLLARVVKGVSSSYVQITTKNAVDVLHSLPEFLAFHRRT